MMAADSLHVAVPLIVPSSMSFQWLLPCRRACSAGASRRASRNIRRSHPACSVLPRTRPACGHWRVRRRWLQAAQRRRRRRPERQRGAKAEDKGRGTGPRRKPVCTWGWRGTGGCRRAAFGARSRQCRHVRVLRTTGHARACRERSHDRPPRRRFPRAPQRPKNRGRARGRASFPRCSNRRAKPAAASPRCAVRHRQWHRPAARLAPGARPTAARFAGAKLTPMSRRATIKTLLVNHQRASPVARQAPALHRARRRGPRRRAGPSLRADRRGRSRRLQGTLRRRPAPFPLHPLARGWRGAGRPAHHAAPHGPHGGRPGYGPRLGGREPLEHRQPAHAHRRARARHTGKDLIIAGDYIADGFRYRAAELATEWLGPRTELEIQQTLQREVEQERWTSLDRTLKREIGEAGGDGLVRVERFNAPACSANA